MKIPSHDGKSEYIEKRSRFIGAVKYIENENDAKEFIASVKRQYHDARHNCWCYIIDGKAERYSDDGEPQGTAGIPMLEVLKREGVSNAVIVVTRYFGGILLGAGGLLRAYTKCAKDALSNSDPKDVIEMKPIEFDCDYSDFETIKNALLSFNGEISEISYGAKIHIAAKMPETENFEKKFLWKK